MSILPPAEVLLRLRLSPALYESLRQSIACHLESGALEYEADGSLTLPAVPDIVAQMRQAVVASRALVDSGRQRQ